MDLCHRHFTLKHEAFIFFTPFCIFYLHDRELNPAKRGFVKGVITAYDCQVHKYNMRFKTLVLDEDVPDSLSPAVEMQKMRSYAASRTKCPAGLFGALVYPPSRMPVTNESV